MSLEFCCQYTKRVLKRQTGPEPSLWVDKIRRDRPHRTDPRPHRVKDRPFNHDRQQTLELTPTPGPGIKERYSRRCTDEPEGVSYRRPKILVHRVLLFRLSCSVKILSRNLWCILMKKEWENLLRQCFRGNQFKSQPLYLRWRITLSPFQDLHLILPSMTTSAKPFVSDGLKELQQYTL